MINNQKTALVAITAIAAVLAVSIITIGNGRTALAETDTKTTTINVNNTGINVPTETSQKQQCDTVGLNSPIDRSCTANSQDNINENGGLLKK